jgi:hypothetical protein
MKTKGFFIILVLLGMWGCNNKHGSTVSRETTNDPDIIEEEIKLPGELLDVEQGL